MTPTPFRINRWLTFTALVSAAIGSAAVGGAIAPGWAQSVTNFGTVTLSASAGAEPIRGYTQGSVQLASIVLNDDGGNLCVGYAESEPDHLLVVQQNMGQRVLRVDSGGGDTTLLVRSADGRSWCGDDTGRSTDATVRIDNMAPGEYEVWVGSFDSGTRYDYRLMVQ